MFHGVMQQLAQGAISYQGVAKLVKGKKNFDSFDYLELLEYNLDFEGLFN